MKKYQQFKEAVKSPPPERLAKVEYQSHFMQMFGVAMVSVILIVKGFWYIIFAFIFSVGVSYSQGMTAYAKYRMIMSLKGIEKPNEFEDDISPSRRRSKIINYVFGAWGVLIASVITIISSVLIVNPSMSRWYVNLSYLILIPVIYCILYFFIMYWIAYPIYKKKVKGG